MVFHPQLGQLIDLARSFADTTIILNHLGGLIGIGGYAGRQNEALEVLRSGLRELARCPNVLVKLGGLGMFLRGSPLLMREPEASTEEIAAEWGPLVHFALDTFGPSRCMFESNFPVDSGTCSYRRLWNVFKRLSQRYSSRERRSLFAQTAARAYRLEAFAAQ